MDVGLITTGYVVTASQAQVTSTRFTVTAQARWPSHHTPFNKTTEKDNLQRCEGLQVKAPQTQVGSTHSDGGGYIPPHSVQ